MLEFLGIAMNMGWSMLSVGFPIMTGVTVKIWQVFLFAMILGVVGKKIKAMMEGEKHD